MITVISEQLIEFTPPIIKECKILFDKAYVPSVRDDNEIDNGGDSIFVDTLISDDHVVPCTVPEELHPLAQKAKAVMHAQLRHHGIIYMNSSTHLSNSMMHFYSLGNMSKLPVPGCIKYIFEHEGKMVFAIQHQLDAHPGIVDPFKPYTHFPAKLYSSNMCDKLKIVHVDWIMCHFSQWQISSEHVVVSSLSQVHFHFHF